VAAGLGTGLVAAGRRQGRRGRRGSGRNEAGGHPNAFGSGGWVHPRVPALAGRPGHPFGTRGSAQGHPQRDRAGGKARGSGCCGPVGSGLCPPSMAVPPRGPRPRRHFPFPTQPFRELQNLPFLFSPVSVAGGDEGEPLGTQPRRRAPWGLSTPSPGRHVGAMKPPTRASPHGRGPEASGMMRGTRGRRGVGMSSTQRGPGLGGGRGGDLEGEAGTAMGGPRGKQRTPFPTREGTRAAMAAAAASAPGVGDGGGWWWDTRVCVPWPPPAPFAPARGPPPDPDPFQPGQRLPLRHLPPTRERGGAVRGGSRPGAGPRRRHPGQHPCQSLGEQHLLLGWGGRACPPPCLSFPTRAGRPWPGSAAVDRLPVPPQIAWGPTAEKTSECAFKKKSQEVRPHRGGFGGWEVSPRAAQPPPLLFPLRRPSASTSSGSWWP